MNTIDDILQERLERLEAGESLADCLVGLSPEDAELLQLASQLKQFEAPIPTAAGVAAQRAAILSAAPAPPPPAIKEEAGFLALLANFFHSPTRIAGAVALAIIAMVAIGLWLNRPNTTPELAQNIEKETAVSLESSADANDTNVAATIPDKPVDIADPALAAEDPGSTAFLPILSMALQTGPNLASLTEIQGLVEIKEVDGSWQAASNIQALETGTLIRTGAFSSAKLTFFDNSVATLGPETGLTLEQIDAKRPDEGFRTVVIDQWQGQSKHAVQFRNDSGSHYEVITPDGSGIARGTEFQVDVLPEQLSRIAVTEGRVDVTGNHRTVSVTPGKLTTIPVHDVPTAPTFSITGRGELSATGDAWVIAGQAFIINENTEIIGDPQIGDEVFVNGYIAADGQNIANRIEVIQESPENQFNLTGTVSDTGDDTWVVSGQTIHIDEDTDIDDDIVVDDLVHIVGFIDEGSILVATSINQLPQEDDELPFSFTGIVQQIDSESWQISGVTINVNAETAVSAGIQVGDIVEVKGLILDDQDWLATSIEQVNTSLATFNITGAAQSMDPWQVAGISFTTNQDTVIDADIMVDDIVQVTGRILADGTWLADTIKLLDDNFLLEIIFAGIVDEIDPWVVNGLPLDTNEASQIDDDIEIGDLVRVTARILEDGTWLATQIDRLRGEVDEGCVSVTAVVTQIGNGTLILSNGSSFDMDEVAVDGTLKVGSVVMIIACVSDDGSIEIEEIIILFTPSDTPPSDGDDNDGDNGGTTTICHKPGTPAEQTKTIPESALGGHLGHGDTVGPCP